MRAQRIKTHSYNSNKTVLSKGKSNMNSSEIECIAEISELSPCQCPKVICCDTDQFQHYAVEALLSSQHDTQPIIFTSKHFYCQRGKDLISKIEECNNCHCRGPEFVIIDYDIGHKNSNGIELILKLRGLGYRGKIMLRTCKTELELRRLHDSFENLIKRGLINFYLNKNDLNLQRIKMRLAYENF